VDPETVSYEEATTPTPEAVNLTGVTQQPKAEENAAPERISAPVSMVKTPQAGGEVGARVPEPEKTTQAQVPLKPETGNTLQGPVTPQQAGVGELQMAIVPGAKEFIEQDVIPQAKRAAKGVSDSMSELNAAFRAPNMSDESKGAAGIVRQNTAELAQKDVQIRAAMDKARKMFNRAPVQANLKFINDMETGKAQATPELTKISQSMRAAFDDRVAQVRALGTGKLEKLIENYFPHLWEQPALARGLYSIIFGKRPLEGPRSFLKKRTIPTTADGIAAGLKPVSTNPVELTLLKLHDMDRYIMAHKILNEMKDVGLAKFVRATEIAPDGYTKIDDRIADVYEGTTAQGSLAKRGTYYAPDDAARIINNYLSPGLRKYALFRGAIAASNVLNQFQLGLGAYHMRFTAIDAAVSKLSLAIEQMAHGEFKGAAKSLATASTAPVAGPAVENLMRGTRVLKEYTKPGTQGGDMAQIVDALVKGGGRVEMDKFYKNSSVESFWNALRNGNYPGAFLRAPFAVVEAAAKPVMEFTVPRMKLGIFADMARAEMERNPTMTLEQQRAAFGKIWDSVDNRMGQMVYDNLFWNKTLKDSAMLGTRSLGWNLGTVRELGGGVKDLATTYQRVKAGEHPMTRRIAYTMALPMIGAMLGAVYQYLATGKGPQELQDSFMPKTGQKLPDGSDERVILPTYLKDILPVFKAGHDFGPFGAASRLERMAVNKQGPAINMITRMLENKDFYGTEIRHPNDSMVRQAEDEVRFMVSQFKPFSFQGVSRRVEKTPMAKYESLTGIMPVNKELTRTKAMQMISDYNTKFGGAKTREEADLMAKKRDLRDRLAKGDEMAKGELAQMVKERKLTPLQAKNITKEAHSDPRVESFKRLPLQIAQEVYDAATPEEKELWTKDLQKKVLKYGATDQP
jgi:hypothetical protein